MPRKRMKKFIRHAFVTGAVALMFTLPTFAQQVKRTAFDVTNYVMDVTLVPTERKMNATVDVTFTPLEDTHTVSFELNGSLKIDTITRLNAGITAVTLPTSKRTICGIKPTSALSLLR